MHTHISSDDVPLLWTPSPRFIQIMRNHSGLQHPQYFFSQTDRITTLLRRLAEDSTAFGPIEGYLQVYNTLTKLLDESRLFSSLTGENLRHLEPNVRSFVNEVQTLDGFMAELDYRRSTRNTKMNSKKRARSDNDEEETMCSSKRREACGPEMMEFEAEIDGTLANVSPLIQASAVQSVSLNGSFDSWF